MPPPLSVYFDANIAFDVFEQKPELFPQFEELVSQNRIQLFVSDLDLMEMLKGNHFDTFAKGIDRLLSVSPKWIFLTDLAIREVRYEFALYQNTPADQPFRVFDNWTDFLPHITSPAERASVSGDLQIPTSAALLELYPPHSVAVRLKEKWKPEMKQYGKAFPDVLKKAKTRKQLFCEVTADVLGKKLGKVMSFCGYVWNRPDIHVPKIRHAKVPAAPDRFEDALHVHSHRLEVMVPIHSPFSGYGQNRGARPSIFRC